MNNTKIDYLKSSERIVYLVFIAALVVALITISTCNKKTQNENLYLASKAESLGDDIKDIEEINKGKDSTINEKTKEIIAEKEKIQELIKTGQISTEEANQKIKQLKAELANVKEQMISEKTQNTKSDDSLNLIISDLKSDKRNLQSQVESLQDALSKKSVQTIIESPKNDEIKSIKILIGTILTPKSGLYLKCSLPEPVTKDETFTVYIYDEYNELVSPQNGIFSFKIAQGRNEFSGQSSSYGKGTFKMGKKYSIAIRNSKNNEIERFPCNVTHH